jgi:hypothetical protein
MNSNPKLVNMYNNRINETIKSSMASAFVNNPGGIIKKTGLNESGLLRF